MTTMRPGSFARFAFLASLGISAACAEGSNVDLGSGAASSGGSGQAWQVWDVERISSVLTRHDRQEDLYSLTWLGGSTLATAGHSGAIRLWDATSGQELAVLLGHTRRITSLSVSADGRLLASAGWDDAVVLWRLDRRWRVGVGSRMPLVLFEE